MLFLLEYGAMCTHPEERVCVCLRPIYTILTQAFHSAIYTYRARAQAT